MITSITFDLAIPPLARHIVSCSAYARHDLEDSCFLKSTDAGRCMKSECVTELAPQATSRDWRMQ